MIPDEKGAYSDFYKEYVNDIISRVENNARNEFEFLWEEHQTRIAPIIDKLKQNSTTDDKKLLTIKRKKYAATTRSVDNYKNSSTTIDIDVSKLTSVIELIIPEFIFSSFFTRSSKSESLKFLF